ncbi:MAG: hypothetical protein LBM75_00580 [Myxococcales bacterium]|jgi:hypothetical protein|nr:hypothetical protein [Myxococcales bacterium]
MAQKPRIPEPSNFIDRYIREEKPKTVLEAGDFFRDLFSDTLDQMLRLYREALQSAAMVFDAYEDVPPQALPSMRRLSTCRE